MSALEEILVSLYASSSNVSISWIWDGDIDVRLGDPVNGPKAEGKVGTVTEIADSRSGCQNITRAASSPGNSRRAEPSVPTSTKSVVLGMPGSY
jgi:hypothetical protein